MFKNQQNHLTVLIICYHCYHLKQLGGNTFGNMGFPLYTKGIRVLKMPCYHCYHQICILSGETIYFLLLSEKIFFSLYKRDFFW